MTPLFVKLNLGAIRTVHALNAPPSFEPELTALRGVEIHRAPKGKISFALAFVTTLAQVERAAKELTGRAADDAILWMVYPKSASKKYRCEFNRDTGWASLGRAGYEPVRQVSVDEDWSALRFRSVEHIMTMKRKPQSALSAAGRKKARASRSG